MTADNDGVRVMIAPPTPAGAVVQQAHLLTNGEEGKDGCPQFEPTKSGGLELQVPIAKLQHCMPTGATDEGQTYALRARIDTFPKDPACQSGDITAEQPFGWPFTAGHVKLVRRLISLGADVNHIETDGSSPLIYLLQCFGARCSGKAVIDMISLLLCAGADVNHEREYYEGREFG